MKTASCFDSSTKNFFESTAVEKVKQSSPSNAKFMTFNIFCYLFFHFLPFRICCYVWLQTWPWKASGVVRLFQSCQVLYIRNMHVLSYVKPYQFHDKNNLATFRMGMECEYVNNLHNWNLLSMCSWFFWKAQLRHLISTICCFIPWSEWTMKFSSNKLLKLLTRQRHTSELIGGRKLTFSLFSLEKVHKADLLPSREQDFFILRIRIIIYSNFSANKRKFH